MFDICKHLFVGYLKVMILICELITYLITYVTWTLIPYV